MSRALRVVAAAIAAAIAAPMPTLAAERPVELVPWIGARGGMDLHADITSYAPVEASASGTLGFGVLVWIQPDAWFETFVDHQSLSFPDFDFAIDYVQFGGGYQPGDGTVRPFVAASLGLTRYGSNPGEIENMIGVSGALGGGFSVPMGKRASFRFEALGYATLDDAALAVSCGPGCVTRLSADGWYQFALRVGVAIRL